MRRMVARMISTGSLAAFSASASAALPSARGAIPRPPSLDGPVPGIQRVREKVTQQGGGAVTTRPLPASPPDRGLPRGSLVDLRV